MIKYLFKVCLKKVIFKLGTNNQIKRYKRVISANQHLSKYAVGEKEWLKKWRKYDDGLTPLAYRIFSRYIGNDVNILPFEILVNIIEPVLNPHKYIWFYGDKNIFDKIIPSNFSVHTFIRNIRGFFYDTNYNIINFNDDIISNIECNKLILKPSLESQGKGVLSFNREGEKFVDKENNILSKSFLESKYKSDFLIQEFIEQSKFTSFFNSSSVNTFRVATYKSVVTGKWDVIGCALRIGATNSIIDNLHAGGVVCGISKEGKLGRYVCNIIGEKKYIYNNVDFLNDTFIVPNFDELKNFAIKISENIFNCNLIALDIVLDKDNNPKLIEINTRNFSGWIFQFLCGSVFGKYTDEVMEYCWKQNKSLTTSFLLDIKKNN